jgi:hypothetical protein
MFVLFKQDHLDLIDFEGNLKEIPNKDVKNFAIAFLTPKTQFAPVKIDIDVNTDEKTLTCMLNESRQSGQIKRIFEIFILLIYLRVSRFFSPRFRNFEKFFRKKTQQHAV